MNDLDITTHAETGQVSSVTLYGQELLDRLEPCRSELWVNGLPLKLRRHTDPNDPTRRLEHLKGERFVNQFSGWSLAVARVMGARTNLKTPCFGIQTLVRRELCDQTCPCPGPGGPTVEAPLWVDSLTVLGWNWRFWGDDTRMIFPSSHSNGPVDELGHCGYEHDTPENAKRYLQNVWRRIYPGCMVIHGGVFRNVRTGHWLALTCRRPQVGYVLNIEHAGRGVCYDFTLHTDVKLGQTIQLPEIKLYWGPDPESMWSFMADYATLYYEEPPEWVHRTVFGAGLAWNNRATWTQQAEEWERQLDSGSLSGINYCLVTNRPILSGTTPTGYEPDPNHGSQDEFRAMVRRLARRGVPVLVWMSHSGMLYQGGRGIEDDWFIRGIDGRVCASWGSIDQGGLTHINPGHPGYIDYTKKWIRFYLRECGAKGIFFDCLSWAFPPDFAPRPWMRYPSDTNLLAIRFMEEVYACIKECDPEAVMLGEGASLDGPVNVLSICANPRRGEDGLGPRDFLLQLNRWGRKRLVIDQGPMLAPGSGYCRRSEHPDAAAANRYLVELLRKEGGARAFEALPGDLSVRGDRLFVPWPDKPGPVDFRLPEPYTDVKELKDELGPQTFARRADGVFPSVPPGIYRMRR